VRNRISNYLLALVLTFGLTTGLHAQIREKQLSSTFTADLIREDGANDFTADQSHGGNKITGLADGTASTDAVNKGQLDAVSAGLDPKGSVRACVVGILDDDAEITGSPAYDSVGGTSARGQITATLDVSGDLTVDGVKLALNDRVKLRDESSGDAEVHGVDTVADSGGDLNSTFFTFFTNDSTGFYVWFDINGAGVDPNPSPAAGTTFTGITVAAATNVTANDLALAIETAIEASAAQVDDVVVSTNEITITNEFGGNVTDAADGSAATSFTIATDTQGTGLAGDANGVWEVTVLGATITLERTTDFDEDDEVTAAAYFFVEEGTVNAGTGWVLTTDDPITVGGAGGTTLEFTQFSAVAFGSSGVTTVEAGTAASVGVGQAARVDHQHDTDTVTATSASAGQANAEGAGTSLARATHTHQHTRAAPASNLGGTSSNATGASGNFSDASHTHAIDTGSTTAASVGQAGSAGSGNNLAFANHEHAHTSGTALSVSTANAQGSSGNFADAQHLHDSPAMTDANKREVSAVTSGTNETTGLTIASTPALDTQPWIIVNTASYAVGDGLDTSHFYYSGDACSTPRATAAIVSGDVLCQGDALSFNLDASDLISQMFQTFTNN